MIKRKKNEMKGRKMRHLKKSKRKCPNGNLHRLRKLSLHK
jgi:hypothetical protein